LERILEINSLRDLSKDAVDAARESLVIGRAWEPQHKRVFRSLSPARQLRQIIMKVTAAADRIVSSPSHSAPPHAALRLHARICHARQPEIKRTRSAFAATEAPSLLAQEHKRAAGHSGAQ
jgi:hypothetical protein